MTLRVDLHLHSYYSPDSSTSLADLIARCREVGLDRIALTDHNTAAGAFELRRLHPGLAIAGEEIKTREGEVIGLFLTEQIKPWLRPEETLDRIHEQGGLTYLAHPCDRFRSSFMPDRIIDLAPRVDIIETYNAWARPVDNQLAAELCQQLGKVAATGSDAHAPSELGLSWMEMEEYEDPADFLDQLRRARHVVTELSGSQRRA